MNRRRILAALAGGIDRSSIFVRNLSAFDTLIVPTFGHVYDIEILFYRKSIPTAGGYLIGTRTHNSYDANDVAVYASSYWYRTICGALERIDYSMFPFVTNRVQSIVAKHDLSTGTVNTSYNGSKSVSLSSQGNSTTPISWYIGARHNSNVSAGYSEPITDTGIVRARFSVDGVAARDFVPSKINGRVCLFDRISMTPFYAVIGSDPTFVDDYRKDGISDYEE